MTLRIKSPLRSAEGISRCRASRYVFLRPHGTAEHGVLQALCNTLLCGQYPHSLGYFPMQRALNFSLLPPPRPPFSRRRLCICGGSFHTSDDTAAVFFGWLLLTSAHSDPRSTSRQDGTKRGGENKKDPYLHTRITGNTKKRTAHVR